MKNPNHGVSWWLVATIYVSLVSMSLAGQIHEAAKSGDIQTVRELLSGGIDINAELDEYGATALHWAVVKGQEKIAELLVSKGARLDQKNRDHDTPLHLAVAFGHTDIVELLLSKGAAIDERRKDGFTPLYTAVNRNEKAIAQILIASGATVDAKGNDSITPLYQASGRNLPDMVALLLSNGADPNLRNKDGDTPLHIAAAYDNKDIVELLLSGGANPQTQNIDGKTPADLAVQQQHFDIAEYMNATVSFSTHMSEACGFSLILPDFWTVLTETEIVDIYARGGSSPGGLPCFAASAPYAGSLAGFVSPALSTAATTFLTNPESGLREQYAEFVGIIPANFQRISERFTVIDEVQSIVVLWRVPIPDTTLIQKQLCLIKNGKAYLLSAVSNEDEFPKHDSALFVPVFRSFHALP